VETITYSGRIAATMGSNLGLMKKNKTVLRLAHWPLATAPNAAGHRAAAPESSKCRFSGKTEFSIAGPIALSKTAFELIQASGVKNSFGGMRRRTALCLRPSGPSEHRRRAEPDESRPPLHGLNLRSFLRRRTRIRCGRAPINV